jgi:hypothetical protein
MLPLEVRVFRSVLVAGERKEDDECITTVLEVE